VRLMCRVLEVFHSGYCDWRSRPESARSVSKRHLLDNVGHIHAGHHELYGSPRVHPTLSAEGRTASRGRVESLMRRHGIRAIAGRRFGLARPTAATIFRLRPTSWSNSSLPRCPRRSRSPTSPTCPPARAGSCAVLDLSTRKIVGWSLRDHTGRGSRVMLSGTGSILVVCQPA
jgi:transposase InsO family protein